MCSEPPCENGFLVPLGDAVHVPANAPGFWWRASRDSDAATSEAVTVTRVGDEGVPATELEVTRTWVPPGVSATGEARPGGVLLGLALQAGERLHVEAGDACVIGGRAPFTASVAVTPAAPVPTRLGSLSASAPVRGPLAVASDGGGCSRERQTVYADVMLELHPVAQPWADLLLYETRVDGALYTAAASAIHGPPPHVSWQGRGRDRIFALCEGAAAGPQEAVGVSAGAHEVQLIARLPGSDTRIASDTVRVELTCPAVADSEAGAALYDAASFQIGALVVAAQLALILYILLTRSRKRER